MNTSRNLWGEFTEDGFKNTMDSSELSRFTPLGLKRLKLSEVQNQMPEEQQHKISKVLVNNPMITQTIEVMKQTEMLQSLIDTYSNKLGTSNYLVNPCQIIPEVHFPPENVINLVTNTKFTKPIWFVPPQDTKFTNSIPQTYPELNSEVCRAAIRKAVCGQLRVAGFTDITESALILFAEGVEEFLRNLMEHIRDIHNNNTKLEMQRDIETKNLEKAYYSMTNTSLTQLHNYFKHHLITRNRNEISEFNGVLHEYDKLMKESENMQKEDFQNNDFVNIFESAACENATNARQDFPSTSTKFNAILGALDNSQVTLQLDTKSGSGDSNNLVVDIS